MKRMVLILVALIGLVAICTGCSAMAKGVCDGCGQTEKLNTFNGHGAVYHYCDDCYRIAKLFY